MQTFLMSTPPCARSTVQITTSFQMQRAAGCGAAAPMRTGVGGSFGALQRAVALHATAGPVAAVHRAAGPGVLAHPLLHAALRTAYLGIWQCLRQ